MTLWTPDRQRTMAKLLQQEDRPMNAERQRIINEAARILDEINQLFLDVAHWNTSTRARLSPDDPPIDPDPDGQLMQWKRGLEETLKREAALGHFPTPMKSEPKMEEEANE